MEAFKLPDPYYYFNDAEPEESRTRVHNRPECLVIARLNGITVDLNARWKGGHALSQVIGVMQRKRVQDALKP